MRASSALIWPITRCATAAPTAQPTSRPPCSRTRSSMARRSASSRLASARLQAGEDEAEHLLVPPALDHLAQRAADHPAGAGAAEDARQRCGPSARRARPSSMRGQQPRQQGRQRLGGRAGGGRVGRGSGCRMPGRSSWPRNCDDLRAGEHVPGDEPAERAAQPLLLARDDGGVRDRQAERVAEQRGHREPVGDAADEAGLGGGLQQVGGDARRQRVGGHRQRRHAAPAGRWRSGGGPAATAVRPGRDRRRGARGAVMRSPTLPRPTALPETAPPPWMRAFPRSQTNKSFWFFFSKKNKSSF